MEFNAITPLAGGTMDTYYYDNEYPYDLNGALDFTRVSNAFSPFPYPQTIGHVEGLLPQFDDLTRANMQVGINAGILANMMQNPSLVSTFPDTMGGLRKVKG